MLKEALEFVVNLRKPSIHHAHGMEFTDKNLSPIVPPTRSGAALELKSLKGLVRYLRYCGNGMDGEPFGLENAFLVINSHVSVSVLGRIDEFGRRTIYANAEHDRDPETVMNLGKYMAPDQFISEIRSAFYPSTELDGLLRLISSVSLQHTASITDNGVAQQVCVKSGVEFGMVATADFYSLAPMATFPDLGPIHASYFIRLRQQGENNFAVALHCANMEEWVLDAKKSLTAYLEDKLPGWVVLT